MADCFSRGGGAVPAGRAGWRCCSSLHPSFLGGEKKKMKSSSLSFSRRLWALCALAFHDGILWRAEDGERHSFPPNPLLSPLSLSSLSLSVFLPRSLLEYTLTLTHWEWKPRFHFLCLLVDSVYALFICLSRAKINHIRCFFPPFFAPPPLSERQKIISVCSHALLDVRAHVRGANCGPCLFTGSVREVCKRGPGEGKCSWWG